MGVCVLVFLPHATRRFPPDLLVLSSRAVAKGEWWRVLTCNVEHVDALHIFMNGTAILGFGPVVERIVGSTRLLLVSLLTGLTSSAAVLAFLWNWPPSAGASGVICGWIGLALPIVEARGRKVLLQWIILLVLISLLPAVSWAAHLGGFLGGVAAGLIIRSGLMWRRHDPFKPLDRLFLPLFLLAAVAVWLAVRFHTHPSLSTLQA